MSTASGEFRVTLRESRMVIERLLQFKGMDPGRRWPVADAGMFSASLGLSGFAGLEATLDLLMAGCGRLSHIGDGQGAADGRTGGLVLDAAGKHAWLVAEEVSDLLTDLARIRGDATVAIQSVTHPEELKVVSAIVQKHGLGAVVEVTGTDSAVARLSLAGAEPRELMRIAEERIAVDPDLWWHLFHLSNEAQAPDTRLSRMHTGSVMMMEDGSLVSADEEEFEEMDVTMLEREKLVEAGMQDEGDSEC
ncbi:hypothetical protein [Pseudooceanicola algae]|uniref:Uncharacterized protein n=1 Tax=Pseudooceanicola algae TaxID=1537215 RepID=A0A418SL79_9RHOB|nr:hypothetical protein [Pseudooceanicola algae]QPM90882.1 hypothetical protein PSAL_021240 [Pseudooceanicola algae]